MRAVICPAYLPNVAYFAYLTKQGTSYFATDTHYQKQTFRNRSEIYGANGKLNLIIPIIHKKQTFQLDQDVEISYEINWQKEHWKSICSAYRSSPFFEYYEADLAPFFDKKTKSLFDLNLSLIEKIMMLLELPYSYQKISFHKDKDQRIDALSLNKSTKKSIFGFSNQNFAYLTLALGTIFLLTSFLMQSNSTYMFADQELDKEQLISPSDSLESKEEMDDMKQIDLLNNIDGSFVNDQEY